jgi:hypothetical protein
MAEFRFRGTWNDSWGIVTALLEDSAYSLVLDRSYDKPEPQVVTRLDESVKALLEYKRSVLVWSTKYSRWPPVMKRLEGGEAKGTYYVMLTKGGPFLHLVLPPCYEEGGALHLGIGDLYYPKWTIAPGSDIAVEPSPELRQGFKEVKAVITRQLVGLRGHPHIWIGQEANRLVEEGQAILDELQKPSAP